MEAFCMTQQHPVTKRLVTPDLEVLFKTTKQKKVPCEKAPFQRHNKMTW